MGWGISIDYLTQNLHILPLGGKATDKKSSLSHLTAICGTISGEIYKAFAILFGELFELTISYLTNWQTFNQ